MRLARVAVVALLLLVPACGGSQVSEAAATRLQPQVQALREAAATGSQDAANRELAELRALVAELSATDELSQRGARRVLAAADRVEANLALLDTTTTAPPTTTATTAPPPPAEEEEEEKEKEKEEEDQEEEPEETVDPTVGEDTTPGDTAPGKDDGGKGND
ncbi:MAG: hypothetical protein KY452_04465 [Actinobacteria bacterium]|nr:hypothetical protein [Actinomycetota bacterium]